MKNNNLDLLNSEKLEENFSNAVGSCGLPPLPCVPKPQFKQVCNNVPYPCPTWKEPLKKCNKQVCTNVPNGVKIDQSCTDRVNAYKKCVSDNAKQIADKAISDAKKAAGDAAKNVKNTTQDIVKNISNTTKDAIKSTNDQLKAAGKNIKNTYKELSDKAKKARKKLLNKAVLGMAYTAIRTNQLGIASKLYPAIANSQDINSMKYKSSFLPKSKMSYAQIVVKWRDNGGNIDKLNEAIRLGSKIRFGKNSKSNFNGNKFSNISDIENDTELYYPVEEENVTSTNNDISEDENSAYIEETGEEEVGEEQKISGWKKFLAFIMSIFKKNKANDEDIYEDGSEEADNYQEDMDLMSREINYIDSLAADGDFSINNDYRIGDNNNDSDSSDKMFGVIPKTAFWIGVSIIGLSIAGFITYKIIKQK